MLVAVELTPNLSEIILKSLIERANDVLQPYRDPAVGVPDPSFGLQLPDDIYTSSNLFAVQKLFQGQFQFDVFFESGSTKQALNCECTGLSMSSG